MVFWIMLITLVGTSTIFAAFGSGELQQWDNGEPPSPPTSEIKKKQTKNDSQHSWNGVPGVT